MINYLDCLLIKGDITQDQYDAMVLFLGAPYSDRNILEMLLGLGTIGGGGGGGSTDLTEIIANQETMIASLASIDTDTTTINTSLTTLGGKIDTTNTTLGTTNTSIAATNTKLDTVITNQGTEIARLNTMIANGPLVGTEAALGVQSITGITDTSAVSLTPVGGATRAVITTFGNNVVFREDSTAPASTTAGHFAAQGSNFEIRRLAGFRAIAGSNATTATLFVTYY